MKDNRVHGQQNIGANVFPQIIISAHLKKRNMMFDCLLRINYGLYKQI